MTDDRIHQVLLGPWSVTVAPPIPRDNGSLLPAFVSVNDRDTGAQLAYVEQKPA